MPIVWENILGTDKASETIKAVASNTETKDSGAAKDLIGEYTIAGSPVTVEVKESNGVVTFNVPGQQPYTLNETSKDTFSMAPLPADQFSLKAKRDASGKVTSIIVAQPGGQPEFVRKVSENNAPAMTVDELMQRTIDAAGGEANLRKFTSRVIESELDLENQGVKATSVSYAKAPNKAANETKFVAVGKNIGSGFDYFDGANGEEIYSFAPVDKFAGKRLEDSRLNADFYSQLDWKKNFKQVAVKGTAKVAGEDAWVVTFESEKGTPFTEYYSTKTFLLLKREGVVSTSTSSVQIPYTVVYSDYRNVDGIMMPFKSVNSSVANGNIVTTVRSVKQNVPIDDSLFAPRKVQ
jgi:hypothetical protein